MKNIITTIVIVILTFSFAKSQAQIKDTLLIFTKFENEQTKIKIAPQKVQTWLKGVENGYRISRIEIGSEREFKVLNEKPLKPLLKRSDFNGIPDADTLYGFNKTAISKNLRESKLERSVIETMAYFENLQNEYGFYFLVASRIKPISKISGLEFIDKTAKAGKNYIYKVEMVNHPDYKGISAINTIETKAVIPVLNANKSDRSVTLNWPRMEGSSFLCYNIEKSTDGVNFTKINKAPIYFDSDIAEKDENGNINQDLFVFNDSLSKNYKDYYYRLVGIDIWADEYTSDFILKTNGVDKVPPAAIKLVKSELDKENRNIKFIWNYNPPSDFAGMEIFVSNDLFNNYKKLNDSLLSENISSYLLEDVIPGQNYYLKIATRDTSGNYSMSSPKSAFLPDIYPPAAPKNLITSVDKNGNMVLSWDKNPESDIKAYRVYTSHKKGNKMIAPVSELIYDTSFTYKLNMGMLNKHKYFTVAAIDLSFNYSENSDTIKVNIPDTIGPASALIKSIDVKNKSATLNWTPSSSDDIKSQIVMRRVYKKGKWQKVAELDAGKTSYTDTDLSVNAYQYSIIAVDSNNNAGKRSNLSAIEIKKKPTKIIISDFEVKAKKSKVQLSWKSSSNKAKFYIVYRQSGKDLKRLASVNTEKFEDKTAKEGIAYKYYIVAQDDTGKLHKKSKVEKVRI